jgi:hypothetical protein
LFGLAQTSGELRCFNRRGTARKDGVVLGFARQVAGSNRRPSRRAHAGHELDPTSRVPKGMIGRRLSQEEAKSEQFARVSTANCTRSRCEEVFEDILAIHSGERLFTNFAVHQPVGGLGFHLYTHHLVVRATFRAFEIGGNVSGGHLHPV